MTAMEFAQDDVADAVAALREVGADVTPCSILSALRDGTGVDVTDLHLDVARWYCTVAD